MNLSWSDGTLVELEAGQRWTDPVNEEADIIIDRLEDDTAYWHYDIPSSESMHDRIRGVDGFIDFLETNCYEPKAN